MFLNEGGILGEQVTFVEEEDDYLDSPLEKAVKQSSKSLNCNALRDRQVEVVLFCGEAWVRRASADGRLE